MNDNQDMQTVQPLDYEKRSDVEIYDIKNDSCKSWWLIAALVVLFVVALSLLVGWCLS